MTEHEQGKPVEVEIMIADLLPEKQTEILAALGLKSAADGNYDVLPLFVLELCPGSDNR